MKYLVLLLFVACGPRSVPGAWFDPGPVGDVVVTEPAPSNGVVVQSEPEVKLGTPTVSVPENIVIPSLLPDEPLPSEDPVVEEPSSQPSSVPVEEPTSQPTSQPTADDDDDDDECSSDNWCHGHKVLMCHKEKCHRPKEICIDYHAIKAHKKHGDYRGLCH